MDLTKKVYFRQVYGFLDYFSDLGGLFTALKSLCVFIVMIGSFYSEYQFIMAELFVERTES